MLKTYNYTNVLYTKVQYKHEQFTKKISMYIYNAWAHLTETFHVMIDLC